ncbi:hypothetical protein EDF27_0483 [Curtobacterium sp. PhB136]|nr:hypothetical protein EDF27_0483 [Curtobacterium sp. PhB136]
MVGPQWRDDCPVDVGRKVLAVLQETTNAAERVLLRADRHRRIGTADGSFEVEAAEVLAGDGNDDERLDVVAAVLYAMTALAEDDDQPVQVEVDWNEEWVPPTYDAGAFVTTVDDILLGSRLDWTWDAGRFQQRGNHVLHAEVVKPASTFLALNPKFARASAGFEAALTRLSENQPAVAITDAATAVQEFFRALGVEGGSISDQLNAAARAGIISQADRKLLKPIIEWVNADRSSRGNAHQFRDDDATKADAWLAIHVAAALIVRLANEEPRNIERMHEERERAKAQRAEAEEAERVRREREAEQQATAQRWAPPSRYDDEVPF